MTIYELKGKIVRFAIDYKYGYIQIEHFSNYVLNLLDNFLNNKDDSINLDTATIEELNAFCDKLNDEELDRLTDGPAVYQEELL